MIALSIVGVAVLYAVLAQVGILLSARICTRLVRFEDGPAVARAPVEILVGAAAILGAVLALRGTGLLELGVAGILALCLCGIWYADVRTGLIPDVFTVVPLVAVVAAAVFFHQWAVLISSIIVFAPFAVAAVLSRGRGMGWGDAKLVALGGAMLGAEVGVLAFGIACAAAVLVAFARNRREAPIAFAPYLSVAMALALAVR